MTHSEKAKELFLNGYNCCQAVLGAYCEDVGLDMETAMRLASSFGAGMGKIREVCGAVSGMFMVEGLRNGFSSPSEKDAAQKKAKHYKNIQNLAEKFIKENGSIICRQLLGLEPKKDSLEILNEIKTGDYSASSKNSANENQPCDKIENLVSDTPQERNEYYYKKRPCAELVAMAASFLDE